MKPLLAALLFIVGCKGDKPRAVTTADLALPAGWSRGFGAAPSQPAPEPKAPLPEARSPAAKEQTDDDEPEVALPPELANRPAPRTGIALYVDGKQQRDVLPDQLSQPRQLGALVPAGVRSLLAHGSQGNVWLAGADVAAYQLRLNRRGEVKLEPVNAKGGGERRDDGARTQPPARPGREHELRDVKWLEARTHASARLAGEPR